MAPRLGASLERSVMALGVWGITSPSSAMPCDGRNLLLANDRDPLLHGLLTVGERE
jgi:hypothetical protein